MNRPLIACFLTASVLLSANERLIAQAQPASPRDELLALVPADAGFCLSLQNLRDESERRARSPWFKTVRASALGQAIEKAKEIEQLLHLDGELQKRFGVNWAGLRDDIFGDAVVLAYWPAPPNRPEQEQGLLLIHARRADLLKKLVDVLNEEQRKSKELKRLEERQHNGVKYLLREDQKTERFLFVDGNLLAFTGKETLIKRIIDRRRGNVTDKSALPQQVNRAGAGRAFATLWVNPRAFDAELEQRAALPGPDGQLLKGFLKYWKPLEAVVLSVSDVEDFEVRLAVQANVAKLPASVQKSFAGPTRPAELWKHFPEDAIVSMAGDIDVAGMIAGIGDFMTPEHRKSAAESLQRYLGTAIKLDLAKEVVPNIGPEWGFFIATAENPRNAPDVVTALAVRPGTGDVKVDQALLEGVNVLALISVLAQSERLAIKRVKQDKIEVSYVTGAKVFPEGVRPAWALKDGYLLLASSPEAVLRFRAHKNAPRPSLNGEAPVLMVSTTELAKLLRARRDQIVDYLIEKNKGLPRAAAAQALEDSLRVLDLINHVTFLQGSGDGQVTWTLRIRARAAS